MLRWDKKGIFRFASLQSDFASCVLARHGASAADLDTVYVVLNYQREGRGNEVLLSRSEAVIFLLSELGGRWGIVAWFLRCLPRAIRDWFYSVVATHRYEIFGRHTTCVIPAAEVRQRFLDL